MTLHSLLTALAISVALNAHPASSKRSAADANARLHVARGDVKKLQEALEDGADINAIGPGGQTPLMASALGGYADACKFLLEKGADPTIGEKDGYTPLHGAAFQGRAAAAQALLAGSIPVPNTHHPDGFAPVHRASWGLEPRHTETVKAFLDAGVSPFLQTAKGETLLQVAERAGNLNTISLIKERKDRAKQWTDDGEL
jgi:ankyrin repeat protein